MYLITRQLKHWLPSKMPALNYCVTNLFTIHIRIAWQMAGWKTKNNSSSTTESELWRNAGLGAF